MSARERLEAALRAECPTLQLREVVRQLLSEGWERDALITELEDWRPRLREAGREEAEDVVLEVLDFLTGFCSPHMQL